MAFQNHRRCLLEQLTWWLVRQVSGSHFQRTINYKPQNKVKIVTCIYRDAMYAKFTSQSISFRVCKLCILISTSRSKFYENCRLFFCMSKIPNIFRKFPKSQVDPRKILGKSQRPRGLKASVLYSTISDVKVRYITKLLRFEVGLISRILWLFDGIFASHFFVSVYHVWD